MRLIDADAIPYTYTPIAPFSAYNDVHYEMIAFKAYIDAMPTVPTFGQWISVKDRLPEDEEYVLIFTAGGSVLIVFYDSDGWYTLEEYLREVTHWMPLPEAPEEENFEKR